MAMCYDIDQLTKEGETITVRSLEFASDEKFVYITLEDGRAFGVHITENKAPVATQPTPKLPSLDDCYKYIPFPKDEKDHAMYCAGIAECHKLIMGNL